MCGNENGTTRPTSNGRIAVMFPSPSTKSMNTYSLFFHESGSNSQQTRAIFRLEDPSTRAAFGKCESIDLRIERHGDLTSALTAPPLHRFRLVPEVKAGMEMEFEFELPERLDLGVSERGIVGRQVTVVAEGGGRQVVGMGMGIVGYD